MPNQRRTTVRRAPVQSRTSVSRSQRWFSVLALFTVVALLVGAIGSAVILDLFDDDGNVIDVDPNADPGEEDEIEQLYREDYAARPDDPDTIATLANYLSQTGGGDEAIELFERALEIAPDDSSIRLDFARALADGGSSRDAELQFSRVIEAQPSNGLALLELARLYRDWVPPRTDEAIATYLRVVEGGADSVTVDIARQELAELGVTVPAASPTTGATPIATPTQ